MLRNQHIMSNPQLQKLLYSILYSNPMDQHTYENWVKIKATFESSGNTNNMFYRRAVEIVKTRKDPLAKILGDNK